MKMLCYFLLNIKHGASQLYLGAKYNCEVPGMASVKPGMGRGPLGGASECPSPQSLKKRCWYITISICKKSKTKLVLSRAGYAPGCQTSPYLAGNRRRAKPRKVSVVYFVWS